MLAHGLGAVNYLIFRLNYAWRIAFIQIPGNMRPAIFLNICYIFRSSYLNIWIIKIYFKWYVLNFVCILSTRMYCAFCLTVLEFENWLLDMVFTTSALTSSYVLILSLKLKDFRQCAFVSAATVSMCYCQNMYSRQRLLFHCVV